VRIHLLGVRGSVPTPGSDFVRYGGNTSCVAVAGDTGSPSLVLDAGTGLRGLTGLLGGAPFSGSILLSHLHWDHMEGLPFCAAIDRDDARTDLYLPDQGGGAGALAVLGRMMSPPNFPILPDALRGAWTFSSLGEGEHKIEGYAVRATRVAHKGGTTYGYRISDGASSLAYLPDHCPTSYGPGPEGVGDRPPWVMDLVRGADVLVHDAHLTRHELPDQAAFGHAALEYAVALAEASSIPTVVLFHHNPARTDILLDAVAGRFDGAEGPRVVVAAEGTVIDC
jgi:phosphoribosyl 1,2-cyclic phosphodiesterase